MAVTRREGLLAIAGIFAGGVVANLSNFAVTALAPAQTGTHPAVAFEPTRLGMGWVLSDDDLSALNQLSGQAIDETVFEISEGVDHYGGDLTSFRAISSGDCAAACASDPDCTKFTYATEQHEVAPKRRMCWLKDDSVIRSDKNAGAYLSGQKR